MTHSKVARNYYDKVTDEADKHNKKLDHNNEHISTHPDWRYAWSEYYRWLRNAPNQEYFEGITFDLVTGECINPRDDLQVEINQENKKEWLRTVKKFKKGLRLRANLYKRFASGWSANRAIQSFSSLYLDRYLFGCK